jgi:hypothetical protein
MFIKCLGLFLPIMVVSFLTWVNVYAAPPNEGVNQPVEFLFSPNSANFSVHGQSLNSIVPIVPKEKSRNAFSNPTMTDGSSPLTDDVIISSEPFEQGAKVLINGEEWGQVPMRVTLGAGSHTIRVYGRQGEGEAIITVHNDRVSRGVRDVVVALGAFAVHKTPPNTTESQTNNILKAIAVAVGVAAVVSVAVIVYVMYAMVERGGWSK